MANEADAQVLTAEVMRTTSAKEWIDTLWGAGLAVLPMAELYLSEETPMKAHETAFLRTLAEILVETLPFRIAKITKLRSTKADPTIGLCLAGTIPEVQMPGSRLVEAAQALVGRLKTAAPPVLREGLLSLLVSEHVFHKCLWCDGVAGFSLGYPPSNMPIPTLYVETGPGPDFTKWVSGRWSPNSVQNINVWAPLVGICRKCHYNCGECKTLGPPTFSLEWMQSLKDDKICVECGKKLLANVKLPKPGRPELVALHRKSFLEL